MDDKVKEAVDDRKNVYKGITTLKMKMIEKDVAKKQIVIFKRDRENVKQF